MWLSKGLPIPVTVARNLWSTSVICCQVTHFRQRNSIYLSTIVDSSFVSIVEAIRGVYFWRTVSQLNTFFAMNHVTRIVISFWSLYVSLQCMDVRKLIPFIECWIMQSSLLTIQRLQKWHSIASSIKIIRNCCNEARKRSQTKKP